MTSQGVGIQRQNWVRETKGLLGEQLRRTRKECWGFQYRTESSYGEKRKVISHIEYGKKDKLFYLLKMGRKSSKGLKIKRQKGVRGQGLMGDQLRRIRKEYQSFK